MIRPSYKRNSSGFTLTELIITIGLISILLSVSTLAFNNIMKKSSLERYTSEIHADLNRIRFESMTRKQQHLVTFNSNSVVFRRYSTPADAAGSVIMTKNVPVPIQNSSFSTLANNVMVTFDAQGYVSGSTATIVLGSADDNPAYNCLVISVSRTNVGKMNGASCVFK